MLAKMTPSFQKPTLNLSSLKVDDLDALKKKTAEMRKKVRSDARKKGNKKCQ